MSEAKKAAEAKQAFRERLKSLVASLGEVQMHGPACSACADGQSCRDHKTGLYRRILVEEAEQLILTEETLTKMQDLIDAAPTPSARLQEAAVRNSLRHSVESGVQPTEPEWVLGVGRESVDVSVF